MWLIALGVLLASTLALEPVTAEAQQREKVYRIGSLSGRSVGADSAPIITTVREEFRKLGYVEGRNVLFEDRFAEGHLDRLPQLAEDLVRHNVDVIIAYGTPHALAARKASQSIPIVGVLLSTPVESGLVSSLSRPGGNVTGLTLEASAEQVAKPLELIAALPLRKQTAAVLFNSGYPGISVFVDHIVAAGPKLNLGTDLLKIVGPADLASALQSLRAEQHGALLAMMDSVLVQHAQRITDAASSKKIPVVFVGGSVQRLAAGGVLRFGPHHDRPVRSAPGREP
jgi:putative ABC transport system substrate-binding protein